MEAQRNVIKHDSKRWIGFLQLPTFPSRKWMSGNHSKRIGTGGWLLSTVQRGHICSLRSCRTCARNLSKEIQMRSLILCIKSRNGCSVWFRFCRFRPRPEIDAPCLGAMECVVTLGNAPRGKGDPWWRIGQAILWYLSYFPSQKKVVVVSNY